MIKVGIDRLALYTSRYALDLATLAEARGVDPEKFHIGLGQWTMSVPAPGEDIVTMAANAALEALRDIDVNDVEMLLFATESGIDQSKSAGLYVHALLGLPARCRVVELKQACYAGTAAIQLALPFLQQYPQKKVLVVASDIARYGLATPGESSQGSGACALVLAANPRILSFEPEYGVAVESAMDFWRPNYLHEALVDGKYSSKLYLTMLEKCFHQYQALSQRGFKDHDYFCYHTPVPRLVEKAHLHLMKVCGQAIDKEQAMQHMQAALQYGRKMGNSYTASLYVSLASLLDNSAQEMRGMRIGFYSYGSGCAAEYFSGIVEPDYQKVMDATYHADLLASRKQLSYGEYEAFYRFHYVEDGSDQTIPLHNTGAFRLARIEQHKRIYEKVIPASNVIAYPKSVSPKKKSVASERIEVCAPGKLILSGEHAVLYGAPALAIAINRYVKSTVTRDTAKLSSLPNILFDLSDLAHHSVLSFGGLRHLKASIKRKYHRFIRGDFTIRDVLQKPFELAQFALGLLAESLNLNLPHGVKLSVQSDLPIGCGMGSSAATILSVMQAIIHYLKLPISPESLYQLALEAETMQHGRASGLDLRIAMQGGCVYAHDGAIHARAIPAAPLFLVNTGTPVTSTGQCVMEVAHHFQSNALKADFAAVTRAMDQAIENNAWQAMQDAVRQNHRLLVDIGVVPERVQQFVSRVEGIGGAAKICGAGSVAGDQAGAVMVLIDDHDAIKASCMEFDYNVVPISVDVRGVHAA